VVFVGEAPGTKEDEVGLPFVGRAGKLLDRAIGELGLSADEVGILNLFKCHPPENRFNALAAETCRPYLERQLELLRPRLLVSLGAHALRQLDPNPASLTAAAGAPRSQSHQILFPLFHPAATFRSRAAAQRWKHDLEELRRSLPRLVSKGL
jgi:DNA polymerase